MAVNYNAEPILTVDGLKQYFKVSSSFTVHAVEDVSFKIYPGETYGWRVRFRKVHHRKKCHPPL